MLQPTTRVWPLSYDPARSIPYVCASGIEGYIEYCAPSGSVCSRRRARRRALRSSVACHATWVGWDLENEETLLSSQNPVRFQCRSPH